MDIRKMEKDELELLSFTDIAYNIIKQDKEPKTTVVLFKEICDLLGMSEQEYQSLVADFFTSLTTDKRFILLNSVNWDLKENHVVNIFVDESEDEYEDNYEDLEESDETKATEDDYDLDEDGIDDMGEDESVEDDDDEEIDDIDDLEIVDEEADLEE
jgi:DNA-directed RNA polymerase subunit delta